MAAAIVLDSSLMCSSCSTNHGSTPVASATDSAVAPARSAWSIVFEPAVVRGAAAVEQLVGVSGRASRR